ncbi:MAG: hypothetical protein QM811_00460 [Pirellulales bacterium]
MCVGIAIDAELLSETFMKRFGLRRHVVGDMFGSPPEVRFAYNDPTPRLPIVTLDGAWDLPIWGNRDDQQSHLPPTGWVREESLQIGKWKHFEPEPVRIPAQRGLEKGVWFPIDSGIVGYVVRDEQGRPHVYMLTRAADDAYRLLTRHDRMPVWAHEYPF